MGIFRCPVAADIEWYAVILRKKIAHTRTIAHLALKGLLLQDHGCCFIRALPLVWSYLSAVTGLASGLLWFVCLHEVVIWTPWSGHLLRCQLFLDRRGLNPDSAFRDRQICRKAINCNYSNHCCFVKTTALQQMAVSSFFLFFRLSTCIKGEV